MKEKEALSYIKKECFERMTEFFNTNSLPDIPDFGRHLEDIILNMPSLEGGNYEMYQNVALSIMLKMTLDWISTQDGDALREAFNALASTNMNQDKVSEMEDMLDNPNNLANVPDELKDEIATLPGDEEDI